MRLYISGPVTGIPEENLPAFLAAQEELDSLGYVTTVPHEFVRSDATHNDAMIVSINVLTDYDPVVYEVPPRTRPFYGGVALLDGWEQSEGARTEKLVAEACGIPVKTVAEWIKEAK